MSVGRTTLGLPQVFGWIAFCLCLSHLALAEVEPGQICGRRLIMTLPWTICLVDAHKTQDQLKAAIDDGMTEVTRIDNWMSEWHSGTLISEINDNAGIKPVKVTDEAMEAISESLPPQRADSRSF